MDTHREYERFQEDWSIDFGKKRIYRNPRTLWRKIREFLVKPMYPVIALYRFVRNHEDTETGIVFPEIVDSDMLPKVDGIPTRFVLREPWVIQPDDIETLCLGPLTQGSKVLVPAFPKAGFFITIWEVVSILSTVGGAIGFVIMVWAWLSYFI